MGKFSSAVKSTRRFLRKAIPKELQQVSGLGLVERGAREISSLFQIPEFEIPPLPPLPTRTDTTDEAARKKALMAEKMKKGRRSLILTGAGGVEDELGAPQITRPAARSSSTLG